MENFSHKREDYQGEYFGEQDVDKNPIIQFQRWLSEAIDQTKGSFNAMTLSTIDKSGYPNSRIVLLKDITSEGFTFFTNYNSAKGNELLNNNKASLVFFWDELSRQVRVQGEVSKTSEIISDEYFINRPPESKLGAWASPQSSVLKNRTELEERLIATRQERGDNPDKRPAFWGGYILNPISIEFWQGRSNRLHDRIKYNKNKDGEWVIQRLAP